jgi:hypothetical protein
MGSPAAIRRGGTWGQEQPEGKVEALTSDMPEQMAQAIGPQVPQTGGPPYKPISPYAVNLGNTDMASLAMGIEGMPHTGIPELDEMTRRRNPMLEQSAINVIMSLLGGESTQEAADLAMQGGYDPGKGAAMGVGESTGFQELQESLERERRLQGQGGKPTGEELTYGSEAALSSFGREKKPWWPHNLIPEDAMRMIQMINNPEIRENLSVAEMAAVLGTGVEEGTEALTRRIHGKGFGLEEGENHE